MSETNRLDEWIDWFQRNRARVELTSAAAAGAGLSVMGLTLLNVSYLRRLNGRDFNDIARFVLIATVPYLISAVIIHWLWIKPLRRIIPSWLMIPLLGSLIIVLSAGAFSFYTGAVASNASLTMFDTLGDFIQDKVKDGLVVFVVLSLFTLPITAAVYYAGSIVRAVRHWHNDSERPPSILGNQ